MEYEYYNENYRIGIDFYQSNSSLEFKTDVMDMINELNVNDKVG